MTDESAEPYDATRASRLTLLFGVSDHARHRSLMVEILRHARKARLAGATVYQATEGYGTSGIVHSGHLLKDDSPLAVVIVDKPARVEDFLARCKGAFGSLVAVIDDVEVLDL